MNNSLRLTLFILALVAIMLLPILIFGDQIDSYFDGPEGIHRLQSFGGWAWLLAVTLIVSDLLLPVPSSAVIAGLGMIYGPVMGGLIGSGGSLLAGMIAYWSCRLLGPKALDVLVGPTNLTRLSKFFSRHGLWAIAVSRWMPLLPELLCCLAGLARMRIVPFTAALACGSLAMGFAFASLGSAYLERPLVGLLISALLPLALWPFIKLFISPSNTIVEEGPVPHQSI